MHPTPTATLWHEPPANVPVVDCDPFDEAFLADPYPAHERLRDAGPVVWIPRYGVYAAARYDEVRSVLLDHGNYISSAGNGLANFQREAPIRPRSPLLEADPPEHTAARAVVSRVLSPRSLAQLRIDLEQEAHALMDRFLDQAAQASGGIDAMAHLCAVYPLKVFPDAVGIEEAGRENLLPYGDMIFNAFGPHNDRFLTAARRMEPLTQWVMNHCNRDKLRPGGFGDLIYQAADRGEMSPGDAALVVRAFLSAGIDTTVLGLACVLHCLARHPVEYEKLRVDPTLVRPALDEALRCEPVVQSIFRTTARDVELSGLSVAAGHKVMLCLASTGRDPRQWSEPERFIVDRRPRATLSFGAGIHGCVGQVIARLEAELFLAAFIKRVSRIELVGKPALYLNNTLRGLASLPVKVVAA